jgi:hypothetical protein
LFCTPSGAGNIKLDDQDASMAFKKALIERALG